MLAKAKILLIATVVTSLLNACVGLVVGGATAVGMAVHDRRTAGTVVEDRAIEFKSRSILLSNRPNLQRSHINITSYNNIVLLSGEVESPSLRQWVEDNVRGIEKVKQIHNELIVAPPSPISSRSNDGWITAKAKSSLFQISGLPNFDPTRVKIVTERGIVYLFGLVTEQEGDAITSLVRRVGGVQQVVKLFEYI